LRLRVQSLGTADVLNGKPAGLVLRRGGIGANAKGDSVVPCAGISDDGRDSVHCQYWNRPIHWRGRFFFLVVLQGNVLNTTRGHVNATKSVVAWVLIQPRNVLFWVQGLGFYSPTMRSLHRLLGRSDQRKTGKP
jgi:hypothetical protein